MSSNNTSIGPEPTRGGNDNPGNADGCGNKTLGSHSAQQPPTAADGQEPRVPELPEAEAGRGKQPADKGR